VIGDEEVPEAELEPSWGCPGDSASHLGRLGKLFLMGLLRCIPFGSSGFRHQIGFILSQSGSVFPACFGLSMAPDRRQMGSQHRVRLDAVRRWLLLDAPHRSVTQPNHGFLQPGGPAPGALAS
jgi:hypothetical protein